MYKQPPETNNFVFLRGVYIEESFELKIPSFGILMKYQPIFVFFLCSLDAVISHDDCRQSKSNYTEGSSTGLLVFNCQFEKKKSYTHELMRPCACFFQIHS